MTRYDQAFFLDLARPKPGETHDDVRERWNAWRRDPENERVPVVFGGVDFRAPENNRISFEGFEFGDRTDFSGAIFGNGAQFSNALFGNFARFYGVIFGNWAQFSGTMFGENAHLVDVSFGDRARFSGVKFGKWAWFKGARFGHQAQFIGAKFEHGAKFLETIFGDMARFDCATFGMSADFADSTFGQLAKFLGATFEDDVSFGGVTFDVGASFGRSNFVGQADFTGKSGEAGVGRHLKKWEVLDEADREQRETLDRGRRETEGFGPSKFSAINFASAHFRGYVSFVRRSFERPADFTGVHFDLPPDFDGATSLQRIDFTGARAGFAPADRSWWRPDWTTDSKIAVRLRALRSQIEATKNHDFERDLYIEERKAERGIYAKRYLDQKRWGALVGHAVWIAVMGLYWAFADYGRSWLRPAAWLGVSIPAFDLLYARLLADRRETAVTVVRKSEEKAWDGRDALALVGAWRKAEARVLADYDATVGQLAVSNAVPFVGPLTIDADAKKFLFCGVWPAPKGDMSSAGVLVEPCRPIPPPGFQAAMIGQNLFSILLVFFIGLALRNYFRVK